MAIHELMEETNGKLSNMQADYDQLLQSTVINSIISLSSSQTITENNCTLEVL